MALVQGAGVERGVGAAPEDTWEVAPSAWGLSFPLCPSPSPCPHPVRGAGPRLLSPLQLAPALPLLSMGGGGGKHPGGRGDPGVSAVTLGTGAEVGAIHHAFPRCLAEIRFHRQLLLLGLCCSRDTEKVLREPLAGAEPPEAPLPPSLPFQGAGPSAGPQQWSPASFPDTRPPRWAPGGVTPAQRPRHQCGAHLPSPRQSRPPARLQACPSDKCQARVPSPGCGSQQTGPLRGPRQRGATSQWKTGRGPIRTQHADGSQWEREASIPRPHSGQKEIIGTPTGGGRGLPVWDWGQAHGSLRPQGRD